MESDEPVENQEALINEEIRRRRRNNARLRKEEEERRLIEEGSGPRKAKTNALKNALWNKVERTKRQHSPSPEENESSLPGRGHPNQAKPHRKRLQVEPEIGKMGTEGERERRREGDERDGKQRKASGHKAKAASAPPRKTQPRGKPSKQVAAADDDDSSSITSLSESDGKAADLISTHHESECEGNDSDNNDDDFDVMQLSAREAQEFLENEKPQSADSDAAQLFDNDIGVKTIGRGRHASSSEASRPPTSESEGPFVLSGEDSDSEVNEDSDIPMRILVPSRKPRQSKSASQPSKRDLALDSERPKSQANRSSSKQPVGKKRTPVVMVPSDNEDEQAEPEDRWPKAIQLRVGALMQQRDVIRALCRDGIKVVEKTLVTRQAWPELNQGMLYRRQVLLEAIEALRLKHTDDGERKQEDVYRALKKRIMSDDAFVRTIGKWVVDRLSHHRGVMRSAASDHIALFQLGVGDTCAKRVQALLENDVYVYPGHWASDKDGKPVWMAKTTSTDVQIYLNPALVDIIKTAFFGGPTAFGYKFMTSYASTHPDLKEPELTISIVALGATAFFAALYEWRDGKKAKSSSDSKRSKAEKFEGDNFKKVYERHINTLETLRAKKINTYHKIMSTLYSKIVDVETNNDSLMSIKGSALAVLDLDGLD